jgi:predicted AlkP superfamily pyrophosphatase or phosphodiesterase
MLERFRRENRQMTRRGILIVLLLAATAAGLTCTPVDREADRAAGTVMAPGPDAPRLIVLVVIDQFRADYLSRFADRFGPAGFRRLISEGAHCTRCFYPYALTETAPGHTTLATGTTPDRHGIVSNGWYGARLGRYGAAVDDPRHPLVGGTSGLSGASPHHLLTATLGDQLSHVSQGRSRVFGVAGKDRAAILSSGHSASGAYWPDRRTGRFMSSTYYGEHLPAWVESFNDRLPIDRFAGRTWEVPGGEPVTLPATVDDQHGDFFSRFTLTPYFDEQVAAFARELIVKEDLGADADVDYLAIGLSGHDWLGHEVGPYHPAIAALAEHTDALLADLLLFLDERLGEGAYWLAVASDHGVSPTVEQARERGLPGRILDQQALREAMLDALAERFGVDEWLVPVGNWTRLRINRAAVERHGVVFTDAARVAGEAALEVDGILGYWAEGLTSLDAATSAAAGLSTFTGRSPDLLLITEPYTLRTSGDPAQHGTPHPYDTHVPLILFGPPFRPGQSGIDCSPVDLVPTLARALGIPPPAGASGRPMAEILVDPDGNAGPLTREEQ